MVEQTERLARFRRRGIHGMPLPTMTRVSIKNILDEDSTKFEVFLMFSRKYSPTYLLKNNVMRALQV